MGSTGASALDALRALVELALPLECGGCRSPGLAWCPECADAFAAASFPGGVAQVWPDPCPEGLPDVWSTRSYRGVTRAAVVHYKDGGRRDLLDVLAPPLGRALVEALVCAPTLRGVLARGAGPVLVVPVPSSRASVGRRGEAVLQTLVSRALAAAALPRDVALAAPALRMRRRVADQAGLGSRDRAANLEHAMDVRPAWRPRIAGSCCLLADDVLTTGATLAEAARALRQGGARSVVAATLAATARHTRAAGHTEAAGHTGAAGIPERRGDREQDWCR